MSIRKLVKLEELNQVKVAIEKEILQIDKAEQELKEYVMCMTEDELKDAMNVWVKNHLYDPAMTIERICALFMEPARLYIDENKLYSDIHAEFKIGSYLEMSHIIPECTDEEVRKFLKLIKEIEYYAEKVFLTRDISQNQEVIHEESKSTNT